MSGSDILREVDEALRVEQAKKFWGEHGKTLIAFAAVLILGTAAQSGWNSYQNHQSEISTSKFLDALKSSDPLPELQKLSAEKNGSGSALAGLSAAALAIGKQDWKGAITIYDQVATNKTAPKTYRDLATVQIAALKMDHEESMSGEDILKSISPIANDKESEWRSKAIFLSALVKAHKNKDFAAARADLQKLISAPDTPPSFLTQVKALDEVYKIKGSEQK